MQPLHARVVGLAAALSCAAAAQAVDSPIMDASRLTVEATMQSDALTPGEPASFTVTVNVADGWSAAAAGMPRMFLQLDTPDSVTLAGEPIKDHRKLARNEFVMEPMERLIDPGTTTVEFALNAAASDMDTIGVNVIAYLREGDDGPARFERHRLELPITPAAAATAASATNSTWGDEDAGLHIGAPAVDFELPRADGSKVRLSDYRGKQNVIVTTYRAFW